MKHLGDITKISGYTAPIVDCIIGGSPCQDLSVAGKRAGLDGERSGLYMEQIRIVKEMRENDRHNGRSGINVRPRYMVWENVPGAFSSNKAEDFRIVLEELAKIADEDAVVPMPPKGKWTSCGCIMGDGWSIAWRVLDAQFWGVPQRRRRIALVADFGGQSAPEILFVRKSVSGHLDESGTQGEGTSADASRGIGAADCEGNHVTVGFPLGFRPENVRLYDETATTICNGTRPGFTCGVCYSVDQGGGKSACNISEERSPTLTCTHGGEPAVCYEQIKLVAYDGSTITSPVNAANPQPGNPCHTLSTDSRNLLVQPICCIEKPRYIVRRLTPLECERLQGYPDGWTDIGEWVDSNGKKRQTTDTARYKALGNSIALPPWKWVLKRLCSCYERDATMASLFDGIGGFPYLWEQLNGKGSCLWASEIEDFPMAVTKSRIG